MHRCRLLIKVVAMSVSKAKECASAARNQSDPKKAVDELAKAIVELAASIRKLEAKVGSNRVGVMKGATRYAGMAGASSLSLA